VTTGYLRSNERSKRASSAAGPRIHLGTPSFPQFVLREATAEYAYRADFRLPRRFGIVGRVTNRDASVLSIFSFLRTISDMSGAGFDSSMSSEEVFKSTTLL
jgi:hypothetical protein